MVRVYPIAPSTRDLNTMLSVPVVPATERIADEQPRIATRPRDS
jgi:hypothetical protein